MIEIIPNWHPIFVHFSVALFSTSVGITILFFILKYLNAIPQHFVSEFEVVGRWCLWIVAFITIGTISAGFYAYYTVKHDEVSHAAMTVHRNWALLTAIAIFLMAGWSAWRYYKQKKVTPTFLLALLFVQGLLLTTAWHGSELVYRYGVGVMSLPQAEEIGHQHSHKTTMEYHSNSTDNTNMPGTHIHNHDTDEQY